jgi:hypothetical protein
MLFSWVFFCLVIFLISQWFKQGQILVAEWSFWTLYTAHFLYNEHCIWSRGIIRAARLVIVWGVWVSRKMFFIPLSQWLKHDQMLVAEWFYLTLYGAHVLKNVHCIWLAKIICAATSLVWGSIFLVFISCRHRLAMNAANFCYANTASFLDAASWSTCGGTSWRGFKQEAYWTATNGRPLPWRCLPNALLQDPHGAWHQSAATPDGFMPYLGPVPGKMIVKTTTRC